MIFIKITNMTCYNCGRFNHYSDNCPYPKKEKRGDNKSVRCYKCNGYGHYSDKCNNQQQNIQQNIQQQEGKSEVPNQQNTRCYKCNGYGHYSDRCNNQQQNIQQQEGKSEVPNQQNTRCYKCNGYGHYSDRCNNQQQNIQQEGKSEIKDTVEVKFKIKLYFEKMWGRNSAKIHDQCEFSILKKSLIDKLLILNIITQSDLDNRNKTPHIDIKGDETVYNQLNNTDIIFTQVEFNSNTIEIKVNGYHITLLYKVGIIEYKDVIKLLLKDLLKNYIYVEPQIEQKSESKSEQKVENLCVICCDNKYNIIINPCNHICVCDNCIGKINKCPICRVKITSNTKIFLC